jgi:hypothetical protein
MCPERRIPAADDGPPPDFYAICEVYLMTCRDDTTGPKEELWVCRINNIRIWDGVNLIHSFQFGVPSQLHLVTTADNIQMTYEHVVANEKFANPDYGIEMSYLYIVFNYTLCRIDYAEANPDTFTDAISKKKPIIPITTRRKLLI